MNCMYQLKSWPIFTTIDIKYVISILKCGAPTTGSSKFLTKCSLLQGIFIICKYKL